MSLPSSNFLLLLFSLFSLLQFGSSARKLYDQDQTQNSFLFQYHNGPLLTGQVSINLLWYGKFKPSQRAIVTDFITSLSSTKSIPPQPSVATWWKATDKFYKNKKTTTPLSLSLGTQSLDQNYSLGKSLTTSNITTLASSKTAHKDTINVVLTAADVTVDGFCLSKCGTHGSSMSKRNKFTYIWVGNSETQCPGYCAWPFHQPMHGPQTPPLVAPNNDVGMDGIIINLATLMAGTATNPYGNGYYQGPKEAPLEAVSACSGIFGKGAYPGYAGEVLVDGVSGGSYNAYGFNGRKYLLPSLIDPSTSTCSPLV